LKAFSRYHFYDMGTRTPSSGTSEWFLDVQGKKIGPYSAEQIAGLLSDKEIRADHRVTSDRLKGEWIEVRQLVSQMARASGGKFAPPPRPATLDPGLLAPASASPPQIKQEAPDDPTRDLFDSLQAARDKMAQSKLNPGTSASWSSSSKRSKIDHRIQPQIILLAGIIVVLGAALWGVSSLLQRTGQNIQQASTSGAKPASTPLRALGQPTVVPPPLSATSPAKPAVSLFPAQTRVILPAPKLVAPPKPAQDWRHGEAKSRDERDDRDRRDERDDRDNRDPRDEPIVDSWEDRNPTLPPPGYKAPVRAGEDGFEPSDWRSDDGRPDDAKDSGNPSAPLNAPRD